MSHYFGRRATPAQQRCGIHGHPGVTGLSARRGPGGVLRVGFLTDAPTPGRNYADAISPFVPPVTAAALRGLLGDPRGGVEGSWRVLRTGGDHPVVRDAAAVEAAVTAAASSDVARAIRAETARAAATQAASDVAAIDHALGVIGAPSPGAPRPGVRFIALGEIGDRDPAVVVDPGTGCPVAVSITDGRVVSDAPLPEGFHVADAYAALTHAPVADVRAARDYLQRRRAVAAAQEATLAGILEGDLGNGPGAGRQ